jgi:hypothetical protein
VARLYAGFLAAVGVLPGDCFIETTGSRLSNDGINGCKKHIEGKISQFLRITVQFFCMLTPIKTF